ncbi:uncharacterized protein LOC105225399 isoform X2 [Bactrocera dorsalis]|uniref:Uncharacterized protein LOC105225399 isoform X2 n=1 Tax=Bactrocera dorsalis TaxID=27457 RepID=A0ABM3K9T2_BACDO|nr:uncharacterized protein LOC105225399 isoform X2 [Bactrocera dorsalis]
MSFINKLKSTPLPPIKNIINVAVQTARQHIPEKKDYEQPGGNTTGAATAQQNFNSHPQGMFNGGAGEGQYQAQIAERPTELNPFRNPNGWKDTDNAEYKNEEYQNTSFTANEYDGRYQQTDGFRQGSVASEGSSFVCEGEGGGGTNIDEFQAAWNVTNAIQGMFIVSLPFAVLHGGYWAIIAMVGIAYICCYTGKVLVQCLYEPDPNTGQMIRVRDSYVAIAKWCVGIYWQAPTLKVLLTLDLG